MNRPYFSSTLESQRLREYLGNSCQYRSDNYGTYLQEISQFLSEFSPLFFRIHKGPPPEFYVKTTPDHRNHIPMPLLANIIGSVTSLNNIP